MTFADTTNRSGTPRASAFVGWLARGCGVILVGWLGLGGVGCSPPESGHALERRELAMEILGETLAASMPEGPVLAIGNPFATRPGADGSLREAEEAAMRGLSRGLGDATRFLGVAWPALREGALEHPQAFPLPPGATTPLSFLSAPGAWDRIREEHPAARIWVSAIGFPADLEETGAWTDPEGPRWAMFLPDLRLLGGPERVREALTSGRLLAAVLQRPGVPAESEPLGRDRREEFDRRFLLLTRETAESVLADWGQLYP